MVIRRSSIISIWIRELNRDLH